MAMLNACVAQINSCGATLSKQRCGKTIKSVENTLSELDAVWWGDTQMQWASGGRNDADRDSQLVHVCGEQSTITKMHRLKLDPYRYQTESWSRQADATRQSERKHTHTRAHACVRRHTRTQLPCPNQCSGKKESHYLCLHLRVRLLIWFSSEVSGAKAACTISANHHPLGYLPSCLSVCRSGWVQMHTSARTGLLWSACQIPKLVRIAFVIAMHVSEVCINASALFPTAYNPNDQQQTSDKL